MKIAVLVHTAPSLSGTFISRHVIGLGADLVAIHGRAETRDLGADAPPTHFLYANPRSKPLLRKLDDAFRTKVGHKLDLACRWLWDRPSREFFERYIIDNRPSVILSEFALPALAVAPICKAHGVPLVVHFHGYDASTCLRSRRYRLMLEELFRQAAAAIAVSDPMKQTLEEHGCPASKIFVIPCGANVAQLTPSEGVASRPCRFVAIGRLVEKKAPLLTLKAFQRTLESVPGCSLSVVGDGPLQREVDAWIAREGLQGNVTRLGNQPHEVVRDVLKSAGAFVQHSVTARNGDMEGSPVAVCEASAACLPVVATRHAGIPEMVIDGETGFLVEERDWEAMAERMILLARDPDLRRRMGEAGRRHIEKAGDSRLQVEKLREVLRRAVG